MIFDNTRELVGMTLRVISECFMLLVVLGISLASLYLIAELVLQCRESML
jgi:hypothetical protein